MHRLWRELGRIRTRLLLVNVIVLLVPALGIELARIVERQLLGSLERDMKNQAAVVRAFVEEALATGAGLDDRAHERILTRAAEHSRTRIRLLDTDGFVAADSHANGPPEGPEPEPPTLAQIDTRSDAPGPRWPNVGERPEVKSALAGTPDTRTRVRDRRPGVFMFVAEPVRADGAVRGVVYVVRSTQPVLLELYRIRAGLTRVLVVALVATAFVTLLLAWSISRPLAKLSRAAKRIAAGELAVVVPVGGGGEIRELGESFAAMKDRLDARLRYISDFAADVAHEFKSPLTSIRGAAELLEDGAGADPQARRRFLHNIDLDVARLDRLVSRLLELSRIEASSEPMGIVDLEALVRRVAERACKPETPVVVRFEAESRYMSARESDLETALTNLVDNAVRFSPADRQVVVTAVGRPGDRSRDGLGPTGEVVRVKVVDHGSGISPAHLPRIFDRFFTTDQERRGTGLGLAIVKSVVEAHGGRVSVDSAPGEGATFTVDLPVRRKGGA